MSRLRRSWLIDGSALFLAVAWLPPAVAAPSVELELATDEGFPIDGSQKWFDVLTELGVARLRIRGRQANDSIEIDVRGTKSAPVYFVTGRLTARNELVVPEGRFNSSDGPKIAAWLANLGEDGVEGVTAPRTAFGLTPSQLELAHDDLKSRLDLPTKGLPAARVIKHAQSRLKLKLVLEPGAAAVLAAEDPVRDELGELSAGTALAALARPAGLVLKPRKSAAIAGKPGEVEHVLAAASEQTDAWPIGWPIADRQPLKVLPGLFENHNVEIEEIPCGEALAAIQGRLKVPFLFDHNAIVRHRIDLAKPVSFPSKKTFYGRVLDKLLFDAGMKYELRTDEADQPFLWITTLKKA